MDEATIKSIYTQLTKGLKTPEDLSQMTVIKKIMIEIALNTEFSEYLGYNKYLPKKDTFILNKV